MPALSIYTWDHFCPALCPALLPRLQCSRRSQPHRRPIQFQTWCFLTRIHLWTKHHQHRAVQHYMLPHLHSEKGLASARCAATRHASTQGDWPAHNSPLPYRMQPASGPCCCGTSKGHATHFVALHLSPLITGQPPCSDVMSLVLLSGPSDQNSSASPFLGLTAMPLRPHSA